MQHVVLLSLSAASRAEDGSPALRRAAVSIARAQGLSLADATLLLEHAPIALPAPLEDAAAEALIRDLAAATVESRAEPAPSARVPCSSHHKLEGSGGCEACGTLVCTLCFAMAGGRFRCAACLRKERRKKTFFRVRVGVLLTVLFGVLLYAYRDVHQRHVRNDWRRPLRVALVVLELGPVDPAAIEAFRRRAAALEQRLQTEHERFAPGREAPIQLDVRGPIAVVEPPPTPSGDGIADLLRYTMRRRSYLGHIDDATGVGSAAFDSIIYVVAKPAVNKLLFVEGLSDQNGRIGIVTVELDQSMADFALFVAAHELFHTLGASDKYEEGSGKILVPSGLADPDQRPLYPQRAAEIMARHRAISETSSAPPESLSELSVGARTAEEIGWITR